MAEETWIDVMPAIELARGVPVVGPKTLPGRALVVNAYEKGTEASVRYEHDGTVMYQGYGAVRVDLDDPQGFGYVLRWFCQRVEPVNVTQEVALQRWVDRWLAGTTTDADRLALARAIAEVSK